MKKSLKIISFILAVFLAAGIFTACQSSRATRTSQTSQSAGTSAASVSTSKATDTTAGGYPLTLNDANATPVTIASKPQKIVSMPLGACEMLMSLVDKSRIEAMTRFVDDPKVSNVADAAKGVGQRVDSDAEKIIALQPDLVILDSWTKEDFIKQLRDAKLTVFVMKTPSDIGKEEEQLQLLGNIVGEEAKAQETVKWMDQKIKAVSDKLAGLKAEQKLSVLDYSEMGSTSGKDTNFDDTVSRAGLINPVSKAGLKGWPQLSKEMIVKYNPDIIMLPSWYYDTKISFDSLLRNIKGDKALAGVKAVKNNKIISVPYQHISTTSQYAVLGIEDVAKAAYPELFK
ncbi:MAG TPA: ABC transporter substrate-binding protein [Ruminiclostridium sp.]|nr:ABC transporter substrate-binding protein [Ruminiclostridium sp.]